MKVIKWPSSLRKQSLRSLFVLEGFLTIFSAFAGAQHRSELQAVIKDIGIRRFTVRSISGLHQQYQEFLTSIYMIVTSDKIRKAKVNRGDLSESDYKTRLKDQIDEVLNDLKKGTIVEIRVYLNNLVRDVKFIFRAAEDINFHSIWDSLEREDDNADNAWTNDDWSKNEMLAHWQDGDITKSLHAVPQEKAPLVDIKDDPRDQIQSTAIESEMKYDDNEDDEEEEKDEHGYEDENSSYSHDGYHRH